MPGVRAFTEEDAPRVAALHGRVFFAGRSRGGALPDRADDYYRRALLENPWRDDRIRPLVYEDAGGDITGFVGIIPRPMVAGERRICAGVLSSFMVDPGRGSPVVAAGLLKRAVSSGQDLTFGNGANDAMRTLWQASGRRIVSHLSMRWWRLLRPAGFAAERLRGRGGAARMAGRALDAAADPLDRAAGSIRALPVHVDAPSRIAARDLTPDELACCIGRDPRPVRPSYSADDLAWLLRYLADPAGGRPIEATGFEEDGRLLGWCVARRAGRTSQVLQLGAFDGRGRDVIAAAARRAFEGGAATIQGRLDTALLPDLWDARCIVKRGAWFLIDSPDRELLAEVHSGRAFISSLETASLPMDW